LHPGEFAALPIVALTCIDPRLNPLMPEVLGIPEEQFIWLRNAGNIITGPTSSTMRSLALACAVKGGREIAVIGHTDCQVRKTSALELTDRFAALGIHRAMLPDNLQEFFGLFASERQNVLRAAEFVRQSPVIGPKIPVHGLLVDIGTGRLEWVVNGYQALENAVAQTEPVREPARLAGAFPQAPEIRFDEIRFPEQKIGEVVSFTPQPVQSAPEAQATNPASEPAAPARYDEGRHFDPSAVFRIVGSDRKIYGPFSADEVEAWLKEGRIALDTLAQRIGYKEWKQLSEFLRGHKPQDIPVPPRIASLKMRKPDRQR
jgi:carbonic anhydrase